ncbi:MAG: TRAP transporter large permease [Hyphomicrobiales bacterium]
MTGVEIAIGSIILIVVLIYCGLYIPVALGVVSFIGVWVQRGDPQLAINLLKIAVSDSITEYAFATVPLFTFMGLAVSKAGIGKDIYEVMNDTFRRVRGGLGMATVAANAVFAAVTGSSIASASVFTRVSVPEMLRFQYGPRFAVGVVAGSSVLGMLIPPSAMLIIYSFVAEQSVGQMFMAGIVPGLLLSGAFIVAIIIMARLTPNFVGGDVEAANLPPETTLSGLEVFNKTAPVAVLILVVLGGIYLGVLTPVEAGAGGSTVALLIAFAKRRMTAKLFWETLIETGHVTANILFLIMAASMYSRMLGIAGLPSMFGDWLTGMDFTLWGIMLTYVVLMLFLGTLLDTASIILIVVPLFLPVIEPMGASLVWFGIVTVIGAEIGLLTPPLGISCFVIKATIDNPSIKLKDVFLGAFPFAVVMLAVLLLIIQYPILSIGILG